MSWLFGPIGVVMNRVTIPKNCIKKRFSALFGRSESGAEQGSAGGFLGQRGSVLVEFGIVFAMLVTLLFVIIEGGLLIRARSQLKNATEEASRVAKIVGRRPDADARILEIFEKRGADDPNLIKKIVIFKVDGDDAAKPISNISSSCATGYADSGKCNVYTASDIGKAHGDLISDSWDPASRAGAPEYIGVLVIAEHVSPTGFLPNHEFVAESRRIQVRY